MSISERKGKKEITCPKCHKTVPVGYSICPYCGTDLRDVFRSKASYELSFKDKFDRIRRLFDFSVTKWKEVYSEIAVAPDFIIPSLFLLGISGLLTLRFLIVSASLFFISFNEFFIGLAFILLTILTFFTFVIFAFVCNRILRLLGGEGNFDQTFSVMGYSSFSLLFGLLVTNVTMFLFPGAPTLSAIILFPFFVVFAFFSAIGLHFVHNLSKYLVFIVVLGVILSFTGFLLI